MFKQNRLFILVNVLTICVILYIMLSLYRKSNTNSNKINILGRYVNTYMIKQYTDNKTASVENKNQQSDNSVKGTKKFAIYHMKGCGHCHNFMETKQANGMSKCEELRHIFKNDSEIEIVDFQYGRDEEAKKYNAFPMFEIITENGSTEYNGQREVSDIVEAINNTN